MADTKSPLFSIEKSSLIPIGTLLAVVITATIWLQGTLLNLEHKLDSLNHQVNSMEVVINKSTKEVFSRGEMSTWIELFKLSNPSISIPKLSAN